MTETCKFLLQLNPRPYTELYLYLAERSCFSIYYLKRLNISDCMGLFVIFGTVGETGGIRTGLLRDRASRLVV